MVGRVKPIITLKNLENVISGLIQVSRPIESRQGSCIYGVILVEAEMKPEVPDFSVMISDYKRMNGDTSYLYVFSLFQ